jgi:hypothetical protein
MCSRRSCTICVNLSVYVVSKSRGRWQVDLSRGDDSTRPPAHAVHPIGKKRGFPQVVCDEHDREALRRPEIVQHTPELFAREGVERTKRLVEHEQLGLMDERTTNRCALLHAAGQLPGNLGSLLSRPTVLSNAFARSAYSARLRLKLDRYGSTISSGSSTLSSAVRHGNRFGAWNTIPTIVSGPATSLPPTTTVPCVGARKPLQSFMNVDLPHPDGPTMATKSPC